MSDVPLSSPPRVAVTAEFLAECRRKQAAYAETRRRHREAFERHSEDVAEELAEAIPATLPTAPLRRRSRGKVHDPRQLKFEL